MGIFNTISNDPIKESNLKEFGYHWSDYNGIWKEYRKSVSGNDGIFPYSITIQQSNKTTTVFVEYDYPTQSRRIREMVGDIKLVSDLSDIETQIHIYMKHKTDSDIYLKNYMRFVGYCYNGLNFE